MCTRRLETLGLVAVFLTQMGSILYWRYEPLANIVTVFLIGVNGVVILAFGFALVRAPTLLSLRCVWLAWCT